MTEDADGILERVTVAGDALEALAEPGRRAADAIGAAFRAAGAEIEDALVKAARTGELSFGALADSVGRDVSAMALDRFVRAPLGGVLDGMMAGAGRAATGSGAAGPVTVNLSVPAAAPDLHHSLRIAQIAAAAGRAAARAMRRL